MRIERTNRNGPAPARPRAAQAGGAFRVLVTGRAGQTQAASPASLITGLVDVQDDSDAAAAEPHELRHAEALLEDLEGLHRDLLLGRVGAERLRQLGARLGAKQDQEPSADPQLTALVGEIEVRVAVELAKIAAA